MLFGSNLGTAESIATRLAQEGTERGFDVTLGALDDHVDDLPTDGALLVVCSSYNGTPPDNAAAFCRWISDAAPAAADDVAYSVFGCGNTEWAATYQAVPTLLDERLAAHGARRVHPRGEGNAAGGLRRRSTAPGTPASGPTSPRRSTCRPRSRAVATGGPRPVHHADQPAADQPGHRVLPGSPGAGAGEPRADPRGATATPRQRSTRHLEIALPAGSSYRAGDHLGVLPRNNIDLIRRVMARFGLDAGQYVTIIPNSGTHTHLPIDEPAPLLGVLGSAMAERSCRAPPAGVGAGSSIGRWYASPLSGDDRDVLPQASRANRAMTRRIRSMLLRGSTPRWSPARVGMTPGGRATNSRCRVDRWGVSPSAARMLAGSRAGGRTR